MPRGYKWCKGRRRGGPGRPCFYRTIEQIPKAKAFVPVIPENDSAQIEPSDYLSTTGPIIIHLDELEAMRLVDGENKTQDEAGELMGVSRGSIWRLLQSGRKKIITAIYEKREIRIPVGSIEKL